MVNILTATEAGEIERALEQAEDVLDAHGYFHESAEVRGALKILRGLAKASIEDVLGQP